MSERKLVIVTGPARSGTSAMAGTLHHLGLHLPGPFLRANESNPRGFFESSWSVRFHNRLLERAHVSLTDSRPEALEQVQAAVGSRARERLHDWLAEVSQGAENTVVKDPRTIWTLPLWEESAAGLGLSTAVVVMLRHPAGVLGSRATYYTAARDSVGERSYATKNLSAWINAVLTVEAQTRGKSRVFVHYADLLADWRTELGRVGHVLDVPFDSPLDEVEEGGFVDERLHRVRTGWDDVSVPSQLRDLADEIWSACGELVSGSAGEPILGRLDDLSARYATLFADASALTSDVVGSAVAETWAVAVREARADLRRHQHAPAPLPSRLARRLGRARRGLRS